MTNHDGTRGGRTTKIHAVVDGGGRSIAFEVTPGQLGDVRAALVLLSPLPPARFCMADTAYDANGLRAFWVSDFTYVSVWGGMVYVAFVIDAYAGRVVGRRSAGQFMPPLAARSSTTIRSLLI